jgi:O-antigen ligase
MNASLTASRAHSIACVLAIAIAISLMFSPPVANLAEFLLLLLMLTSGEMRRRLLVAWEQPLFKAAIAFWLIIGLGITYSIAPLAGSLSMWGGWRKLLFLPIALALFDDPKWKLRLVLSLIGATTITAVASFVAWHFNVTPIEAEPGVLVRNHSTQGMIFGVAAFSAAALALHGTLRWQMIAAVMLLMGNVALVTPGRSGYAVLLVCGASFAVWWLATRGMNIWNFGISALLLAAIASLLVLAPTSRQRINQAWQEMTHYRQEKQETSMGIRVVFWENTLQLLKERPILGYGTGSFGTAYRSLVAGRTGLEGTITGDPHDQYMKIMAEHGLVGFATFMSLFFAAFKQRPTTPWRLLGLSVLAAWSATSLFNSHFSTFSEGTFLYVWLGAMLAREKPARGEHRF